MLFLLHFSNFFL